MGGTGAGHPVIFIISVCASSDLLMFESPRSRPLLSTMADQPLSGKVIVVVGGTTGLGLSAARAFLAAGARGVVVTGRDANSASAAIATLGHDAAAQVGNATDAGHAPAAIVLAMERFGGFHGLYHVAGGSGRRLGDGPLHEITDDGLRATLELNLHSVILSNRAAVKQFLAQGTGGAVLNMGSVLGWSPSPQFFATHVYAAAKAAIVGFTKSTAGYYAAKNIRLNVLAPALVETPMARRAAADERILRFIATKQPLDGGRIGRPADCDGAAVFLLSDAACFVTGQVLAVDGGWTVCEGQIPEETP
ncbi:MAG: SDR family oxidoreductase [Opitutaceae bacterium]|nr:SDR family oxidoreductase [Opitutaceae bacterium]